MATEALLPQCQRRLESEALLLLLASMMCPLAMSSPAPATLGQPSELTLLVSATEKGAGTLYDVDIINKLFFRALLGQIRYKIVHFRSKSICGAEKQKCLHILIFIY
jgi:hypothetical protein